MLAPGPAVRARLGEPGKAHVSSDRDHPHRPAPYARDAEPISCTGVDVGSGIDGDCTVTYGRIPQGPQGPQRGGTRRWLATVTDVAGNTATVSRAFRVQGRAPQRVVPTGTD